MKKTFIKHSTLIVLAAIFSLFFSCKKEIVQVDPPEPTPDTTSAVFNLGEATLNSVSFTVETKFAVKYAYEITTDLEMEKPSIAKIFGDNENIGDLVDGKNTITIENLSESTVYKIFAAAEFYANEETTYTDVIELGEIRTLDPVYTGLVTVIPTEEYGTIKFHVNVNEGDTLSWNVEDSERYFMIANNQYFPEPPAVMMGGPESIANILTESETITFTGWESLGPSGDIIKTPIEDGQALHLLIGEVTFDKNAVDYFGQVTPTYVPKFDFEGYYKTLSEGGSPNELDYWENPDLYFNSKVSAKNPSYTTEPLVKYENIKSNINSATFKLTPDASLSKYSFYSLPVSDLPPHPDGWERPASWENLEQLYGYDGALALVKRMAVSNTQTEATQVTIADLELGYNYMLFLFGDLADQPHTISFESVKFAPKAATKPASNVTVSGISDPNGENSPWKVWFNVKSTSQDVEIFEYIADSRADLDSQFKADGGYGPMLSSWGAPKPITIESNPEIIAAINSSSGYNMSFDAWQDSEYALVARFTNDEGTVSDPDAPQSTDIVYAISKSPAQEPQTPIVSNLFSELTGEWTATTTRYIYDWNATPNGYVLEENPMSTPVKIIEKFDYPATTPAEVYTAFSTLTTDEVDQIYADFLESAEKYNNYVKGQNRIICLGFDFSGQDPQFSNYKYLSPYDLLIGSGSSGNYKFTTTDDLFNAFGPKWFIQVTGSEAVSVPTSATEMPPLGTWNWGNFNVLVPFDVVSETYMINTTQSSVNISSDKNTLTINPVELEGSKYYLTGSLYSGGSASQNFICSDIILTRGEAPLPSGSYGSPRYKVLPVDFGIVKSHKMTTLTYTPLIEYKKVTISMNISK